MKQCIKYCMIVILAALLHNGAVKAATFLCTPSRGKTECCILSQAPNAQQAIQYFYHHFSSSSFCLEHVDNAQVPNNKSILLRMFIYKMQQCAHAPECDRLSYFSPHPMPDANYYVFGLRKIIV